MENKIIWIIGSMAAGKSTQRRIICRELGTDEKRDYNGEENGVTYHFSTFGAVGALGKIKEQGVCDGLDASFSKDKKIGSILSLKKCLEKCKVVVFEGSQTSFKWVDEIIEIAKENHCDFHLVHLKLSLEQNIERLKIRQSEKFGEFNITDKNIESVSGKNQQFSNIFNKCVGNPGVDCIEIESDFKNQSEIFHEIIDKIWK